MTLASLVDNEEKMVGEGRQRRASGGEDSRSLPANTAFFTNGKFRVCSY